MDKASLIYPMFVKEGSGIVEEIPTMPGQFRYSVDTQGEILSKLQDAGVKNVMFFGIPDHKDEVGSGAYDPEGIVQKALVRREKTSGDVSHHRCVHVRVYLPRPLRRALRS